MYSQNGTVFQFLSKVTYFSIRFVMISNGQKRDEQVFSPLNATEFKILESERKKDTNNQ